MAFNPNFEQIGNEFIRHYYENFDESRTANLADLYDVEKSFLTFEQMKFVGKQEILKKIEVILYFKIFLFYIIFLEFAF